jgi:hypothetical protein
MGWIRTADFRVATRRQDVTTDVVKGELLFHSSHPREGTGVS